ncbi:hypothetical protein [Streptomyces aidingensis]|uniref:Uncharacterized protein n=1 Tax=Streptomyces aidingensis TaxID=910347 RepID=A0A1I1MYM6_9ACTN|nr:hypothetical protein [Streptomyces aidingensis]SFC90012.1 hypothetical protein SAMN05421773_107123 [Streptomyces aidingensis]
MRTTKQLRATEITVIEAAEEAEDPDDPARCRVHGLPAGSAEEDETPADAVRVKCADCGQSIAVAEPGGPLPRHATCPARWNPFGLTVCAGSGRSVSAEEFEAGARQPAPRHEPAARALPESLDWRLQPFSHAVVVPRRPAVEVPVERVEIPPPPERLRGTPMRRAAVRAPLRGRVPRMRRAA